jgi:hypothetical protein
MHSWHLHILDNLLAGQVTISFSSVQYRIYYGCIFFFIFSLRFRPINNWNGPQNFFFCPRLAVYDFTRRNWDTLSQVMTQKLSTVLLNRLFFVLDCLILLLFLLWFWIYITNMEGKIYEVTCLFWNWGFGFHKEHKSVFIKIMFKATGKRNFIKSLS